MNKYKYYLYNILDIIIFYLIILILLYIACLVIFIFSILLYPDFIINELSLHMSDSNLYFYENSISLTDGGVTIERERTGTNYINNDHINEAHFNNGENIPNNKNAFFFEYYKNIRNKTRRRFYWEIIEKEKNNYSNYKEFKNNWDTNTKIRAEIKKEIKSEFQIPIRQVKIAIRFAKMVKNSFNPRRQG